MNIESPSPIDLRDLPPPEPITRIFDLLEQPAARGPYVFLLPREPVFLYPLLSGAGWRPYVQVTDEGFRLTVTRVGDP